MLNTEEAKRRFEETCKKMAKEREFQALEDIGALVRAYSDNYHRLRVNQAYRWDVTALIQDENLDDLAATQAQLLVDDMEIIQSMLGETPSRELVLISSDLLEVTTKLLNQLAVQTMFHKASVRQALGAHEDDAEPTNDAETIILCQGVAVPSWGPIATEIAAMGKRARKAAETDNPIVPLIYAELYQALVFTQNFLQTAVALCEEYGDVAANMMDEEDEDD